MERQRIRCAASALVVGGGIAGMATAISLATRVRALGISVQLEQTELARLNEPF